MKYLFHQDPGHGWLEVTREELNRLGVAAKVSSYSYQRGEKVFLEEDCDVRVFIEAKKAAGEPCEFDYVNHKGDAPLRRYRPYNP